MMKVVGVSLMMTLEDHGLRKPLSKSPLTSRSSDVVQIVEVSSADVLVDVEVPDVERRLREDEEVEEEEEEEEEEEQIEIVEYSVTVEASPVNSTVETRTAEIELPRFIFMLTVDIETTVEAGSVVVQVDRGQACEHLVVTVKVIAGAVLVTTDRGQDLTAQVCEHFAITVAVAIEVTVDLAQETTLHPVDVVVLVLILISH